MNNDTSSNQNAAARTDWGARAHRAVTMDEFAVEELRAASQSIAFAVGVGIGVASHAGDAIRQAAKGAMRSAVNALRIIRGW